MSGAGADSAWSARLGLAAAAGVTLSVLAAIWLGLPDPWWAAISAWRVADAQPAAALDRGAQRVGGTVAGAAFGYLAAGLVGDAMALQAVALFATAAFGTWRRFASPAWSYGWTLGAITAVMVLVQGLSGPEGLYAFAVWRTLEILCGVVVATLLEAVLVRGGPAPQGAGTAAAPPGPEVARAALLAGCAMVLVAALWGLFSLPAVTQMAISVLAVLDRDVIQLRARGGQRLLGCLLGGAYGLAVLLVGPDGLLPWLAALGGGVFLFSTAALGGGPRAYLGIQGGIAVVVTLVVGDGPPDALLPVLDRLAGITLGVALLVVLSYLLAPRPAARS